MMTPARVLARTAALSALAVAAVAAPIGTASADDVVVSQADVRGGCVVAPGDHDVSVSGGAASFHYPRQHEDLSAFADPAGQVAKAYGKARWETQQHITHYGDSCTVDAEFRNVLTVGAGTTDLEPGTPVTLLARVRLGATGDEQVNFFEEYSTTWRMTASYAVHGPSLTCTSEPCSTEQLVDFWTTADRTVTTDSGWWMDTDGYVDAQGDWGWYLDSNHAARVEDGGSLDEAVCDALPCVVAGPWEAPPDVLSPWSHPMGTQTVAFRTRVGDQLLLVGDLATFTQAYDVTVSASVDATDGLQASVVPAEGFEGLDLQLGDGTGEPVDLEAPTAVVVPGSQPGAGGWYAGDVPLTVYGSDGHGSGIRSVTTVVGEGPAVTTPGSSAPVLVSAEGETTVSAWATDLAGNSSPVVLHTVRVDKSAPLLTVPAETTVPAGVVSYEASATDAADPAPTTTCTPVSGSLFPAGRTTVTCSATDHVGHTATASFDVVATEVGQVPDATAAQRLAELRAALDGMGLRPGTHHRLATALKQVERALADEVEVCARIDKLVTSVQRSGLDAPDEELLVTGAREVGELLGC